MTPELDWEVETQPREADIRVVAEGVIQFGRAEAGVGEPAELACFARGTDRAVVAGGTGRMEFERLFVDYLNAAKHTACSSRAPSEAW